MRSGGSDPWDLAVSLLLLGVAGVATSLASVGQGWFGRSESVVLWAALLFPAYIALQLVPLPIDLVGLLNPTRASVATTLSFVGGTSSVAQMTIAADKTWMHMSRVIGYVLIFVVVRHTTRFFSRRPWALAIPLAVLGALEAGIGFSQAAAGKAVLGTYLNENHFAGLLEMILPFPLLLAVSAVTVRERGGSWFTGLAMFVMATGAALAMLAALSLSLSRAGFLSMLGSFAVMALAAFLPHASGWRRVGMVAAMPVVAVVALVVFPTDRLIANLGQLAGGDGRWPVFLDSLRMFVDFPLFGIGLGTYYPGFLAYQTTALHTSWITTHNDYLQFLNELGLLGVILPAAVVALVLRGTLQTAIQERHSTRGYAALACVGGLSAMLFHSVADFNMYIPANAMVFMYIAGIASSLAPLPAVTVAPQSRRASLALRGMTFALSGWLIFNSVAWLAFLQRYEAAPEIETAFCRVGVCNAYVAMASTKARYGGVAASVPPQELIALLERDPAGGYNWLDLGESFEAHQQLDLARVSFLRGVELGPHIPFFLMRAANFHFRQSEYREGLALMVKSVRGNPDYQESAFSSYTQYAIPQVDVFELGLGSQATAQAYLRSLVRAGNIDSADTTWRWLSGKGWADDPLAAEYVQGLANAGEFASAVSAWAEYATGVERGFPKGDSVFNGGYEAPPSGSPFDWRLLGTRGVRVSFDDRVKAAGSRSVRLDFDGTENITAIGISQGVWLPPGRYRLRALVKTDRITTREGVALSVSGNGVEVITESRVGTSDWAAVEREFDVPPDAGLLQLKVVRPRSFRFDNQIAGTAWIDEVSITSVSAR